jgi:hypothetical protein
VVVDAVNEEAASNFEPSPEDPPRLIMKLSTVAPALRLDWP